MRKIITHLLLVFLPLFGMAQVQTGAFVVSPNPFEENQQITVTVSGVNPATWGVTDVYLWTWSLDLNDTNSLDSPTNGTWTSSSESQKMTNNGNGTFSFAFVPNTLYQRTGIGRIGMLVKAKDGTGDKKTQDFLIEVGAFQFTLTNPVNSTTVLNSGQTLTVSGNASLAANFELKANGSIVNTQNNLTNYTFTTAGLTQNTSFELKATAVADPTKIITKTFDVVIAPTVTEAALPAGLLDGLNRNPTDPTKATLVLFAPLKSFVHVIGDFNNWQIDNAYLMKKDSAKNRFWIELTGLTPQFNHMYQYLVDATIRIGDPYSEVVLDEFNDPFIDSTTYPNLPAYPVGQTQHMVTLMRLGDPAFTWTDGSFVRPAQSDLVIYELLIRDFDALHSFNAVRARLQYLKELGINAIELMPVSEFDGNISWGYNPAFHMALDKYYGTKDALKRLVNEAHNMGIAIILDVVYNHATGQNPYFRLWNQCGGDFNCKPAANNPFFNENDPNTAFQFFNDIKHSSADTQAYIDRLNRYWMQEFHVDGYRYDFTKGFTQTVGDGSAFDGSRINILRRMNAALKTFDPNAYVILEHFAPVTEERVLVTNHTQSGFTGTFKGMMTWGNHNFNYGETVMGFNTGANADFSGISWKNRGFVQAGLVGYSESHDEERQMFRAKSFGNSSQAPTYDVKDLNTGLARMAAKGSVFLSIPGPKMIWQFGELGYDFSIDTCPDLTVGGCRVDPKPIRWEYKTVVERFNIYKEWAKVLFFRNNLPIFKTTNFTVEANSTLGIKKVFLVDDAVTDTSVNLKYITVVANFDVVPQNVQPFFQETGDWYDYVIDPSVSSNLLNVTNTNMTITLQPGEFRIYGNIQAPALPTFSLEDAFVTDSKIKLFPNPAADRFSFNESVDQVEIYDLTGRRVKSAKDIRANQAISITELSQGIYLVKSTREGKTSTNKLIKR